MVMTDNENTTENVKTIFDGWRSQTVALFLSLVGYAVMVGVPVLATALVVKEGFTDVQVGRIWANDLYGSAFGAVLAACLVARVNRQYLVFGGIILTVGANALCMVFADYEALLALRVISGIGSGIFTAVAVTTLGGTTNPVRAFNILLFLFAFSTALELRLFPILSMNQIYIFFMAMPILSAFMLKWLPARPLSEEDLIHQEEGEDHIDNWHVPKFIPVICLIAVGCTYINYGGFYNYIDLAAHESGIDEKFMGRTWFIVSFLGLVGCLIAWFCQRFGLFKPLFSGLITLAIVIALPAFGMTNTNIFIALFGMMAMWTFADVFQSGMISHMDRSGTMVALMPAVQNLGQPTGAYIASFILAKGMGYDVVFLVSSGFAVMAMFLYLGIYLYTSKLNGAAAESAPEEAATSEA